MYCTVLSTHLPSVVWLLANTEVRPLQGPPEESVKATGRVGSSYVYPMGASGNVDVARMAELDVQWGFRSDTLHTGSTK
jgi:hypothetical protein